MGHRRCVNAQAFSFFIMLTFYIELKDFLPCHDQIYILHRKKVTFNLSICPGAPGSLTLTDGLDDSVKMTQGHRP